VGATISDLDVEATKGTVAQKLHVVESSDQNKDFGKELALVPTTDDNDENEADEDDKTNNCSDEEGRILKSKSLDIDDSNSEEEKNDSTADVTSIQ